MAKRDKGVFEADRRMELRLRLAAKKAGEPSPRRRILLEIETPQRDVVDRIIDRVREL
jgi:hypothetical protein